MCEWQTDKPSESVESKRTNIRILKSSTKSEPPERYFQLAVLATWRPEENTFLKICLKFLNLFKNASH